MGKPVRLQKALERTIREGHPWVYRDALREDGAWASPGEPITLLDRKGAFLARGHAESGAIAMRVWTTRDESLHRLFTPRFRAALKLRERIRPPDTDAYRLVHGEADRMPGCVIDRYGDIAAMRLDGEGATAMRDALVAAAAPELRALGIRTLLCRVGRRRETRTELMFGDAPDGTISVRERGMTLVGDLLRGQKTGLFLDHRESRFRARQLSRGARVLNLYGYTGGFSIAAALGGATEVTTVDIAPEAIRMAELTFEANGMGDAAHIGIAQDCVDFLDELAPEERFDLIVCDPPSFAPNARSLEGALETYRGLHERCFRHARPGGLVLAASCSSHVTRAHFDETLREGASRARRAVQVLERSGAPADHPRLLAFPEFDYLKVTLCRVLD